jgi:hypothetical protein
MYVSMDCTYPGSQALACSCDDHHLAPLRERGFGGVDGRIDVAMDSRHELVSFDKMVGGKVLHSCCRLDSSIGVSVEVV